MPTTPASVPSGAPPAAAGLAELTADLLGFVLQLRKTKDPGAAESLRVKIDEQFRALEANARRENVPMEDVQSAKYALAAFIDETILTSAWPAKDEWAGRPLQLEYFNDFSAGEEFYNRIDAIRAGGNPRKADLLEVYYACLALGFKGKYVDLQGMEKKKVLMDGLAREIQALRPGAPAGLSPRGVPPDEMPALVGALPAWLVAACCGVLLLFLFLLLSLLLGWSAGDVLKVTS